MKFRARYKNKWVYFTLDDLLNINRESMTDEDYAILNHRHETREEFIGLQDVTGRDIYRGDIVEIGGDEKFICLVEYSNRHARFLLKHPRGYRGYFSLIGNLKIIGNIYENPELLEEAK